VPQVGHLQELYRDARSTEHKRLVSAFIRLFKASPVETNPLNNLRNSLVSCCIFHHKTLSSTKAVC